MLNNIINIVPKLLNILLLSLSLNIPVQASTAKVYISRNEQGVVVFSDTPRTNAEQVVLKKATTMNSFIDTSILTPPATTIDEIYQVEIIKPLDNATIRDNTGSVSVSASMKPIFKRGLSMQLYLDNTPYRKPQTQAVFSLKNLDRGEHQVKMNLIDDKGKVIASSSVITFYMHRASLKSAN
jgi:hypothetical protein